MKNIFSVIIFAVAINLCLLNGQGVDFFASDSTGCIPFRVKFTIVEDSIDFDTINVIKWYFGMGDTLRIANSDSFNIKPDTVVYRRGGTYSVTAVFISDNYTHVVTKTDFIIASHTQQATFIVRPIIYGEDYALIPVADIVDTNKVYQYRWRIRNLNTNSVYNRNITVGNGLRETAQTNVNLQDNLNATESDSVFQIVLSVSDTLGCFNRWRDTLIVENSITVGNVFPVSTLEYFTITPPENSALGADNEEFLVVLSFEVFTRYGTLVYREEAPTINWNGRTNNGQNLNTGVYYYVLKAVSGDPTGKYSKKGFIHLYQ